MEQQNMLPGTFANNDLIHADRIGCDHEVFSEGLKKSLYNYMHGICFDHPLQEWFDFRIPRTTVAPQFIRNIITHDPVASTTPHSRIIWLGVIPTIFFYTKTKKGKSVPAAKITIQTNQQEVSMLTDESTGKWLEHVFPFLVIGNHDVMTFQRLEELYVQSVGGSFNKFWDGAACRMLKESGLVVV